MISWSSRKQRAVADSTCYAEYIALHESSHEAIFLRQLLDSIDFPCRVAPPNTATTTPRLVSRKVIDHVFHSQVKHIRVKFHTIDLGGVQVFRVRSVDNTADILTKPLGRSDFLRLRGYLGLQDITAWRSNLQESGGAICSRPWTTLPRSSLFGLLVSVRSSFYSYYNALTRATFPATLFGSHVHRYLVEERSRHLGYTWSRASLLGHSHFFILSVLCMTTTLRGTCIYFIPANTQPTIHWIVIKCNDQSCV